MNGNAGYLTPCADLDEREQVLIDGVHSAFADEPHEVHGGLSLPGELTGLDERVILEKRAGLDRFADADEVLHHDAAGAQIQMADLAVAHLAFGKAHGATGRMQQCCWVASNEGVPGWRIRESDGVSFTLLS